MNINSEASSVDGIRPPHVTAVAQLPPHFSAILCQLALMGEMSKTALRDNLHILGISPASHRRMNSAEMDDALAFLQLQGWLQKTNTRWRLIPGCENPVFLWLLTQPDARDRVLKNTTAFHLRGSLRPDRSRLWTAILTGDTVRLPQCLAEWMAGFDYGFSTHPAVSLFADDAGRDIFIRLHKDMQTLLLATALNDACYRLSDCSNIWLFARDYVSALPVVPDALCGPMALQALWRDERELLDKLEKTGALSPVVTGWTALYRGDREGAMEAYRQMVGQYRKTTRKRKLHLPPLQSVMAALMLLTRDEPEHTLTLRELTLHAIDEGFGIGWSLLSGLLRERGGTSPLSPPRQTSPGRWPVCPASCRRWCCTGGRMPLTRISSESVWRRLPVSWRPGDTGYRHMKSARFCTCSSVPLLRGR
ncbi:hypothetical protein ACWKX9_23210 [Enterobacter asburiae]